MFSVAVISVQYLRRLRGVCVCVEKNNWLALIIGIKKGVREKNKMENAFKVNETESQWNSMFK